MTTARLPGKCGGREQFQKCVLPPRRSNAAAASTAADCCSVLSVRSCSTALGWNTHFFVSFYSIVLFAIRLLLSHLLQDVFMSNQFSVRLNKTNKLNVNVLLSPFSSVFHGPAICRCA